jgi:hypothetical protein
VTEHNIDWSGEQLTADAAGLADWPSMVEAAADELGPVYIHRVHSTLATKLTIAAKHLSVFS